MVASQCPTTIDEHIRAAPREGQPHLRRLYAILESDLIRKIAEHRLREVRAREDEAFW